MKKNLFFLICFLFIGLNAQNSSKIFTSDIDNYWVAFDKIEQTDNYTNKLKIINEDYIQKGTKGLHAFMEARNYNDSLFVDNISKYPKFWKSIRQNTLSIKNKKAELNIAVENLKKIYPNLKEAEMYFTIGGFRSGGTIKNNMVLVGAEIATGDATIDTSEFDDDWLKNIFAGQSLDYIVKLNIHEYVHTQQNGNKNIVLHTSIKEGACDFIAELALQKPYSTSYLTYGKANSQEIKKLFKKEMFTNQISNWLYNGKYAKQGDLGYYVGYEICKSYYKNAINKSIAIKEIIELDYNNENTVERFLNESKYFDEKINKNRLVKEYNKNRPFIVNIEPFKNKANKVDAIIKEIKINFSKEMDIENISISYSKNGKEFFPITKKKGWENKDKTLVLIMELKPNTEYEFLITNKSFKSKDGFPLLTDEYIVSFRTK